MNLNSSISLELSLEIKGNCYILQSSSHLNTAYIFREIWKYRNYMYPKDIDKINTYLETVATHTISPLVLPPSMLIQVLENMKRGMAQHPHLALLNDPGKDI